MNAKKIAKIEKKYNERGEKKIKRRRDKIGRIERELEEWLRIENIRWWKQRKSL